MAIQPLVSICCVTYNHELYIKEAIDSFLMQETSFDYEIVIGDDCSTDNTTHIISEYVKKTPHKFNFQVSKHNIGSQENFKNTLSKCKGKYIATCDGDDYWTDKNKLQKLVDFLESNPKYVFISHSYKIKNNDTLLSQTDDIQFSEEKNISIDSYCSPYIIHTSSILFTKNTMNFELVKKINCFKDISLFGLLLTQGDGFFIPDEMAVYRHHAASTWTASSYEQNIKSNYESLYYLEKLFKNKYAGFSEFTWNTMRGYLSLIKNNRNKNVERIILKIRILKLYHHRLSLKQKIMLIFKNSI